MEPFQETNKLKLLKLPSISRQISDNARRPKNTKVALAQESSLVAMLKALPDNDRRFTLRF